MRILVKCVIILIPSTLRASKISLLAINCTAMGRARFMFYQCFFFFFFVVGDQTQTSSQPNFESRNLWCLFAISCWNINTRTMLRILFSLFVYNIYFLLVLSKRWIQREIINTLKTLKKGITSAMECADVAAFIFATWQMHCKMRVYFASLFCQKRWSLIYVQFCEYFLWVSANEAKFFGCFIAAS